MQHFFQTSIWCSELQVAVFNICWERRVTLMWSSVDLSWCFSDLINLRLLWESKVKGQTPGVTPVVSDSCCDTLFHHWSRPPQGLVCVCLAPEDVWRTLGECYLLRDGLAHERHQDVPSVLLSSQKMGDSRGQNTPLKAWKPRKVCPVSRWSV